MYKKMKNGMKNLIKLKYLEKMMKIILMTHLYNL